MVFGSLRLQFICCVIVCYIVQFFSKFAQFFLITHRMNSSLKLIVISFSTFYLSALIRVVVQRLPFPVPNNFLIVLIGMAFGYLDTYYPEIGFGVMSKGNPQIAMNVIVPVIMFETSFFTNLESFIIAGGQAALLVFLTFCLSFGIIGATVVGLFDYGWGWNHSIILISIIVTPGPVVTMAFLKRLLATLRLQYFLESEAIVGNCLAFVIFKFFVLWSLKDSSYLKEFVVGLFISPIFGFVFAKVISYWMSKIMNDSVNQVCIIIASLYSCYLLAEMSRMCGIIAVVFMGMFMTGKRSNMSEETEKILLRFLHVMSSYFSCNLTMLCGMNLAMILPLLTWEDFANSTKVFVLVNVIRVVAVAILYPLLKNKGFCLSLNSLLVVAVCNIRGVVTVLLAFCLLQKDFKIHNEVKMFILAISQVVLSLLVNSTIANGVMRYNLFSSKTRVVARARTMLRDLQLDSIFMFRHSNKYIADADWKFVKKFTKIQHPLLSTTFKLNQLDQHRFNQQNKTVEKEAIYRILMMMKCSYWKQHGEGVLSRGAVIRLLHWSSQALARGNTLIFPSKIQSLLTVPKFYEHLRNDVWGKLQEWKSLGTHSVHLQMFYGGTYLCFYLVDCNLTLMQLSSEIFILSSYREDIFSWYNIIFLFCHGMLFVFRITSRKRVSAWEILIILIVLLGFIDFLILILLRSDTPFSRILRVLVMITRFVRVLRMAEVLPFILKLILEICEVNVSMLLAEGFDVARSYIRGRLEVLRLLSHIETDIPPLVLNKFKDVCTEHKLETTKMLGFLQMKYPVISASAKTRQAIRIVLTKELRVLTNLQRSRMMRSQDGIVLNRTVLTKMKKSLGKWMTVMPLSHDAIIANVPWISANKDLLELIKKYGELLQFKSSESLVTQSFLPSGIFIILHGIAMLHRKLRDGTVKVVDFLTTGSVIGEFTFLTGKARHKSVICETDLLVMHIKFIYLWEYIGGKPSVHRLKLSTLEECMWKVVSIKLAYRLLITEPSWLVLSQSEILNKLVSGVVIDGQANPQAFAQYIQTSDIILIYGKLVDLASNEVIAGPVLIPRGHSHLSLLVNFVLQVYDWKLPVKEKRQKTNDDVRKGKLRPIIFVLPTSDDDIHHLHNFRTRWDLCTVTETKSDVTLSSGGSSSRPVFVPREVYFWSSSSSAFSSFGLTDSPSSVASIDEPEHPGEEIE